MALPKNSGLENDRGEIEVTLETGEKFDLGDMTVQITRPLSLLLYQDGKDTCAVPEHVGLVLAEKSRTTKGAILKLVHSIVKEDAFGKEHGESAIGYQKETFTLIDGLFIRV